MTPSLDLFLQPEHLARLYLRYDGTLAYNCLDLTCGSCPMDIVLSIVCLAHADNLAFFQPTLINLHPELFL